MERFEPIFEALNTSGARYVVVGGVAVNLHGHTRFTKDLDLVLDLEPVVARKALETLAGLGFRPKAPVAITDFADPLLRKQWATEKNMLVFQLFRDASRLTVDLSVRYPIDFDILWMDATRVILPRAEIRLASLEHLIAMKRKAGRPHVPTVQSTAVNLDSFSARPQARSRCRDQSTASRSRCRAGGRAIPERDQDHRAPPASAHPAAPRFRRCRWDAVLRDAGRHRGDAARAARA